MIELFVISVILLAVVLGVSGILEASKINNSNYQYLRNEDKAKSNYEDYSFRLAR